MSSVIRARPLASIGRPHGVLRNGAVPMFVLLLVGACRAAGETGPFYAAANIYPGDKPMVRLKKMWMPAETDQISRTVNYLATIDFIEGEPEGKAKLGRPVRLEDDVWGCYSRIVPVRGTSRFIQVQEEFKTRTTILVIDPAQDTKTVLASFPFDFNDPKDCAYAVTRSGWHILLVSPQNITLRDVKQGRQSEIAAAPLLELRKAMIQKRGNPGEWWLTDDLRYIVVEPSQFIWTSDGESGSEPMPMRIGQVALDLKSDVVLYDRQTRQLSVVPVAADGPDNGLIRIADVENVGGKLKFLYVGMGQPIGGATVVIADASGHPLMSHIVRSPDYTFTVHFAGWDPRGDTAWFQTRDARIDLPNETPDADQHLIAWSARTNVERSHGLAVAQIKGSVDGTH
jgi:hypothetical protein